MYLLQVVNWSLAVKDLTSSLAIKLKLSVCPKLIVVPYSHCKKMNYRLNKIVMQNSGYLHSARSD